ncbi:hypothetical protein [Dactylosporangium salmoneum]|uniref:Secreted protein n=1 Tax=Dactylosporangium salmoneum TaxID=53361 RepID=A0ABN3GHF4_9ACTN
MGIRNRIVATGVALVVALAGLVGSNEAQASPGKIQYTAGSSVVNYVFYDVANGGYKFKCAYAGWASVRVNWTCSLIAPALGVTLAAHPGSFSNGSANPNYFFYPKLQGSTIVCAVAYAEYNDGSDWSSQQVCA